MSKTPEKKQLPLLLKLAAERLDDLFQLVDLTHGEDRSRGMRSERRDAIRAVVSALLGRVNLQAGGLAVQLSADGREATPLTVEGLAAAAGVGARRTKRVLCNMRNAGLIEVTPQWRRRADGGRTLLVAACLRRLTRKFWAALGLWGLYVETVRYMQGRPLIRIKAAVYEVAASLGRRVLPLLGGRRGPPPPETAAAKKDRETRNAAFICLTVTHGGTPCPCPACSPDQAAICRALAASLD